MNPQTKIWLDASLAGGLLAVILAVIGLDALLPRDQGAVGQGNFVVVPPKRQPARLKIAVTPVYVDNKGQKWDDMGKVLKDLGKGYDFTEVPVDELFNAARLKEFDVLFLTCGFLEPQRIRDLAPRLEEFVKNGGALYASDWRFDVIAEALPQFRDRTLEAEGDSGIVDARVVDTGLRDVLKETLKNHPKLTDAVKDKLNNGIVPLKFKLNRWKVSAFSRDDQVKVILEGSYKRMPQNGGGFATAPLLVKFQYGKGMVIFTSFHHEEENSIIETELLKYLIFSAVTAKVDAEINETMIQGGFSPKTSNLISASGGDQAVKLTYQCKKPGRLRFNLGFENLGARLKLTVVSPHGKKYEHEDVSTFAIDVPDAQPGHWEYTVQPITVPYPNFPFRLSVGEK